MLCSPVGIPSTKASSGPNNSAFLPSFRGVTLKTDLEVGSVLGDYVRPIGKFETELLFITLRVFGLKRKGHYVTRIKSGDVPGSCSFSPRSIRRQRKLRT